MRQPSFAAEGIYADRLAAIRLTVFASHLAGLNRSRTVRSVLLTGSRPCQPAAGGLAGHRRQNYSGCL